MLCSATHLGNKYITLQVLNVCTVENQKNEIKGCKHSKNQKKPKKTKTHTQPPPLMIKV